MKKQTYLGNEIESADLKAQYDEHARRLLKDKGVLAYILIYSVKEFKDYTWEEAKTCIEGEPEVATRNVRPDAIMGKSTESKLPGEGKMYFDIVFTVRTKDREKQKLYINLEAQKSFYPGYDLVTRGIVYSARLLSEQMDTEYTANNYDGVKKVYSIWVCMNTPEENKNSDKVSDTITEYSITPKTLYSDNPDSDKVFRGRHDLLSVVFICLKKDTTDSKNKLIGMLSTLLSPKIQVREKKKELEEKYNLPMTRDMKKEAAAMCNLSEALEEELMIKVNKKVQEQFEEQLQEKENQIQEKDNQLQEQRKRIEELEALVGLRK